MYIKKLMFPVPDEPDPRFGNMLLEQFGGANGELAAAMQYSIQGINCEDMTCKLAYGHRDRRVKPFGDHRHTLAVLAYGAGVRVSNSFVPPFQRILVRVHIRA
jgi:Manganese containing catalase